MKETIKTSRTAGYLEKIFRALNNDWFGGELEEPIITIQSTPRAYGHVTMSKIWKSKGDERRHELNIGAETLERPIENVVATMMHEAVHLYNLAHGVQDCSRGEHLSQQAFSGRSRAARAGDIASSDIRLDHHGAKRAADRLHHPAGLDGNTDESRRRMDTTGQHRRQGGQQRSERNRHGST